MGGQEHNDKDRKIKKRCYLKKLMGREGNLVSLSYGWMVELLFHSHGSHVFLNTC